jgi:hypothetical protein
MLRIIKTPLPSPRPFPSGVRRVLERHHRGGVTPAHCRTCSSTCCDRSGFAILENVRLIYALYQKGKLRRKDYVFHPGRSFSNFVNTYFDVWTRNVGARSRPREILFFHPKSLSGENQLVAIPGGGDFYEIRAQLFEENPWLNQGCVFLSEKTPAWPHDDGVRGRFCILHEARSRTHLSAKPIDCVFHTCELPFVGRDPSRETARRWFRALEAAWPGSVRRLAALMDVP